MHNGEVMVGAYLVRGTAGDEHRVVDLLEQKQIVRRGSVDLFARSYQSFGVDEAKELRARARTKPIAGEQRVFVLYVPAMTTEAQNALLKTLEEPVSHALFFLITPAPETLLPTIRSRSQTFELPHHRTAPESSVPIDDFLAAPIQTRLEMLKPLYEHGDEGRDVHAVLMFLQALEHACAQQKNPRSDGGIRAVYRARKYVTDKGSLLKSLLEHVALLTPKL